MEKKECKEELLTLLEEVGIVNKELRSISLVLNN